MLNLVKTLMNDLSVFFVGINLGKQASLMLLLLQSLWGIRRRRQTSKQPCSQFLVMPSILKNS